MGVGEKLEEPSTAQGTEPRDKGTGSTMEAVVFTTCHDTRLNGKRSSLATEYLLTYNIV